MRCNVCHGPASFERTVFHGVKPTTFRLCEPCAGRVELVDRMQKISEAGDHAAKTAAVDELIAALHKAKS